MKARLGRYSTWQLRDFVFERGIPMLVVAALLLFPAVATVRAMIRASSAAASEHDIALGTFTTLIVGMLGFAIVLIATNGIVHNDIHRGYYRFLFAKPAAPWRYYAQSFAVNWLGAMFAALVVLAAFCALTAPFFPPRLFAFLTLYYIALGGLVFFVSVLTRFDWLIVAAIWMFAQLLRAMFPASSGLFGRAVDIVFPPAHRLGQVGNALIRSGVAGGVRLEDSALVLSMLWLLGWGTVAFITGLVLLRLRPLAR
ncbi:MAG: hypothetical protein H7Z74_17410 [Anaerolineae bacterium]|nr:hypothetical protein [Gemmatimonadaceae bacterium]